MYFTSKKTECPTSIAPIGKGERYRGAIDRLDNRVVSGWCIDVYNPSNEVPLEIYCNGVLICGLVPKYQRESLKNRLGTHGIHEFRFEWKKLDRKLKDRLLAELALLTPDTESLIFIEVLIKGTTNVLSAHKAYEKGAQPLRAIDIVTSLKRPGAADPLSASATEHHIEAISLPNLKTKLIAFYLPQYHPIPENDLWWGKGFTEWTNVAKAQPLFSNHHQPRQPADLGYYDLRLEEVRVHQAELAKQYGVYGFCYYYYWFAGRRLLERPLDDLLKSGKPDFPFCLCWANETWSRRWDGSEKDVLMQQVHSPALDFEFARSVIPYMRDRRYIRVNNKPILVIYRANIIPDLANTVTRWRELFRDEGIGEIHLVSALTFGFESGIPFGFDADVEFPPHALGVEIRNKEYGAPESFGGKVFKYGDVVETQVEQPSNGRLRYFTPMLGWDNTPRKGMKAHVFHNFSLEEYETWLAASALKTEELYDEANQLVFINAWNEWAEGTYLEPDSRHGHEYLRSTLKALSGMEHLSAKQISYVLSHSPIENADQGHKRLTKAASLISNGHVRPFSLKGLLSDSKWTVTDVSYSGCDKSLMWIESIHPGMQLKQKSLSLFGWVISEYGTFNTVEVSTSTKLLNESKIDGLRDDVYSYHEQYSCNRKHNSFSIDVPLDSLLAPGEHEVALKLSAISANDALSHCAVISLRFDSISVIENNADSRSTLEQIPGYSEAKALYLKSCPVLYVLHDPYPAGAQLFLLRYLEHLAATGRAHPTDILIGVEQKDVLRYGTKALQVIDRLRNVGNVHFIDDVADSIDKFRGNSLIYVNSTASLRVPAIQRLITRNCVLHVHEMAHTIRKLLSADQLMMLVNGTFPLIACSNSVRDSLANDLGIARDRLRVVHSFGPVGDSNTDAGRRLAARAQVGIDPKDFVVLLVGSVNWRKGQYLVSQIAHQLRAFHNIDARFVWVGEIGAEFSSDEVQYEFSIANLGKIEFIGYRTDTELYYSAADIFLLPSLEDPFPLVMIEAASFGLPVFGFRQSGGVAEFAAAGGGFVSDFPDCHGLAGHIATFFNLEPENKQAVVQNALDAANQFSTANLADELLGLTESLRDNNFF